ncbi:serine/threonine-protein phosphatase with EF-hands 2 isoform X2 [Lingula anatina]|uniref:Serine/threonine-protein phosphatase with EF-hands n=1 Tax=Lingula anatina TaxID=7574 RepID=A0A1S3HU17_LINAN|nr:serine/threonine-protein phosphatase with EF-hands 2 isoform X2 [Lingula anatina]|eukprot:XP_013389540.1 serine/threonine-protein phosphatase with EF-hands 2 isoform X2 [Lingula anatina]
MGCGPSKSGESDMGKSEKLMKAALLIQKWYRRYSARLEARRISAWKIYQSIEYAGEQDQLKLYNFFNNMLAFLPPDQNSNQHLSSVITARFTAGAVTRTESEQELLKHTDYTTIRVTSSYKGPRLTFPLSRYQLTTLVEGFKRGKTLHARFLLELLHNTRQLLKTKANVNVVNLNITKQLTICGDLHGKIDDLFTIFYKNGLPGPDNPYIFNGDFVDRGNHSVEVAALLFACLLLFPNDVHINRGNHEDSVMNMRYGFMKEVLNKYKDHGTKVFTLFEEVFSWLPLATMIDKKIFVVHGGISDNTTLFSLETLDRHKYISVLKPPYQIEGGNSEANDSGKPKMSEIIEWKQVLDILWSDPKTQLGCSPNSFRGGGCYFGADVTDKFLRSNNLKLIIRSHECKRDGYEYTHYKQVLTIFSASNYYEEGSNKGAYIKLGQDHKPEFVQYMTTKASRGRNISIRQRVGIIEASAIRNLKERIFASGLELKQEFQKFDPENTGRLHVMDWCCAMENVLHMELPWRTLREKLVDVDADGKVIVTTMFDFCQIHCNFTTAQEGPSLTETLYRNKDSLGTIFRIIDKDNSGSISMQEFEDACDILSRHIGHEISKEQVVDLARCLDINKDGQIDFNEFLEAFRLVDQRPRTDEELVSLSLTSMSDKEADLLSRSSGSTVNII